MNYWEEVERNRCWFECLSAFDAWLFQHSIAMKKYKLNNVVGVRKCITQIQTDIPRFIQKQENLEIVIPEGKK